MMQRGTFPVSKLIVFMLYILGFTSSPSILRAFSWVLPEVTAIIFIVTTILYSRIILDRLSFTIIFLILLSLISVFAVHRLSSGEATNSALIGIISLYMLLISYPYIRNKLFRDTLLRYWSLIFTILSILTILTFFLSYIAPDIFIDVNFKEIFPGNNRLYKIFITGLYVPESMGEFTKNRMVGIMAEPSKMAIIFAINAYLGLLTKNNFFSKTFGWLNLLAGLTTFSTSYFVICVVVSIILLFKRSKVIFFTLSIPLFLFLFIYVESILQADPSVVESALVTHTSYFNREDRLFDFFEIISEYKIGLFFGLVWFDNEIFYYPSAVIYYIYTTGIIGFFAYSYIIWSYVRGAFLLLVILFLFSLTLAWQSYLLANLALIVVFSDKYSTELFKKRINNKDALL